MDQPSGRSTPPEDIREAPDGGPPGAAGASFVTVGLLFYGVLAAAAVVWRIGFYQEPILFASAAAEERGVSLARDLALGLGAGGLLIAGSDWMTRRTAWGDRLARALVSVLGRLSVPDALLLALASGVAEEVFFRGALQPRVGWLAASLLFGCVHFVPRREFLPWTAFAVVAGLVFAALFEWTGNLVAPMTAHVLVNGVNLPWLIRRYAADDASDSPGSSGAESPPEL